MIRPDDRSARSSGPVQGDANLRSRLAFLTRLVLLKFVALLVFVIMSLYTPSTTNTLLDSSSYVSKKLAYGTEKSLEYVGISFGAFSAMTPKKGSVELAFRLIAMEKVILFIGISVVLYLGWIFLVLLVMSVTRGLTQTPRNPQAARLQTEPPR